MKKAIWTVIAVGFLAVSCGNGNIKKVQNGVFPDIDSTITVGQAFANDAILKGGEWKAYEKDGREIVSYTVKFSPQQINAQRNRDNEKPNFAVANQIYRVKNIGGWEYIFERLQPLDKEEQQQFKTAFEPAFEPLRRKPDLESLLADYSEFLDPWILRNADNFESMWGKDNLDNVIYKCMQVIDANYENINNDPQKWYNYWYIFGSSDHNYYQNPEFETALRNSMPKYANVRKDAEERLPAAINAWENTDIKPLVTVNGGSITFFFVMDQADKDAFNIGTMYFEEDLTLNCYNNIDVTWELEYTTPKKILEYIYNPNSRGFDFL